MTRPLQIVEHHHIEGVGMVLREEEVEVAVGALNVSATCTRIINVPTVPYSCVCVCV